MQTIGTNDNTMSAPAAPQPGAGSTTSPDQPGAVQKSAIRNPQSAIVGSSPQHGAALGREELFVKGDELMMRGPLATNVAREATLLALPSKTSKRPSVTPAPSLTAIPAATAATNTAAADNSPPAAEPTQAQMEASLLAAIQISLR